MQCLQMRRLLKKSEKYVAKKTRIAKKEAKKLFDSQWIPSTIRDARTQLQQLVKTGGDPS